MITSHNVSNIMRIHAFRDDQNYTILDEIRLTSWYGIYHIYPIIYRVSYTLGGGDRRIASNHQL